MPISVGASVHWKQGTIASDQSAYSLASNLEANKDNAIKSDCEIAGGKLLSSYFQVWSKNWPHRR